MSMPLSERLANEAAAWESWNEDHPEDQATTTEALLREAAELARRVEGAGRAFIMSNEAPEPHQVAGVTAADDDVINTLDGQRVRLVPEVGDA